MGGWCVRCVNEWCELVENICTLPYYSFDVVFLHLFPLCFLYMCDSGSGCSVCAFACIYEYLKTYSNIPPILTLASFFAKIYIKFLFYFASFLRKHHHTKAFCWTTVTALSLVRILENFLSFSVLFSIWTIFV